MIEFLNVTKHYHYENYPTLDNLSFEITAGKVNTLMLEIQSGKTTIAKLILGIEQPTKGEIFFNGKPIADTPQKDRNIAYFPAEPIFFENGSVAKNLAYPLKIRNYSKHEIEEYLKKTAELYGLDLNQKVKKLSREKRYELCVIRAMWRKIDLLVLDDFPKEFYYLIEKLSATTTLVLTSKIENSLGEITVIKDNIAVNTVTKEKTCEYIKNTLWLRGDEFADNTEENI